MKIVFITTGLGRGGAEMMLLKIIKELDSSIVPYVISLGKGGDLLPLFVQNNITVRELGINPKFPNLIKIFTLIKILRKYKPDVVQTWMYHADLFGGIAAKIAGVRKIFWGIRYSRGLQFGSTFLVLKLCSFLSNFIPNKILSCSNEGVLTHSNLGYDKSKFVVIPNGFNLDKYQPDRKSRENTRRTLNLIDKDLVVGMVARFDQIKNHKGMIQAISLVLKKMPDAKFILVGDRVDVKNAIITDELEKYNITLNRSVFLLGVRTDVSNLMNAFDLLVSPSHGEAFSNVLGEAMACEVPCVATNTGDSAMIIGDTGAIVPIGDMVALAEEIIKLVNLRIEERQVLGERARTRILENFDIKNVVKEYQKLYNS